MMTLSSEIRKLYRPPFKYDKISYIWDANNEMVADFMLPPNSIRPRGWGRMQYMPNGDKLHDACEAFIKELCKDFPTEPEKCVAALNAAWGME